MELPPLETRNGKTPKCTICGKRDAEFEYCWGALNEQLNNLEFALCESCAQMVGSNVVKDIIHKRTGVMPRGNRHKFMDLLVDNYSSRYPDNIFNWNIDTIRKLVNDKAPENETLEYKREIPTNENGKKNIQRSGCAFLNTQGGFMIFGIEEVKEGKTIKELKMVGVKKEADLENRIYGFFTSLHPKPQRGPLVKLIPLDKDSCIPIVNFTESDEVIRTHDGRYYKRVQSRTEIISDKELKERIIDTYDLRKRRFHKYLKNP